jgi:hypothetical protein
MDLNNLKKLADDSKKAKVAAEEASKKLSDAFKESRVELIEALKLLPVWCVVHTTGDDNYGYEAQIKASNLTLDEANAQCEQGELVLLSL